MYWSDELELAVSRDTGVVHIRDNIAEHLVDGTELVVNATDQSGNGLTGSLTLQVSFNMKPKIIRKLMI